MINVIVACDRTGGIGRQNGIPWTNIPEDMKWFRENTMDDVVIMGSGTWNSYGMMKPLPWRTNVVVTSDPDSCPGADLYIQGDVVQKITELEREFPDKTIWIIGGGNLIQQCESIIDEWYITRIPEDFSCDTHITRVWENPEYHLTMSVVCENKTILIVPRLYRDIVFEIWSR